MKLMQKYNEEISGRDKINFLHFLVIIFLIQNVSFAQIEPDTSRKTIGMNTAVDSTMRFDTTNQVKSAPLDIGLTRGLFIITPDQKMQMRILGSVRYLVDFDNIDLQNKNSYNTYEIPTGDQNVRLPNYYNGLSQTRLGFEVTRRTETGDVFVRLETDFAGADRFRIRHAYGQYGRFLIGQSWSLFSQISALPATVNFGGPPGSVSLRTPQIRYFTPWKVLNSNLELALEYVIPDLELPDSLQLTSFQFLPTVSAEIDKNFDWGYMQISGIIPFLSARNIHDSLLIKAGWGLSASAIVNTWDKGKWYFQAVGGKAITPFINNLNGTGLTIITNPDNGAYLPFSFGGYITYEHTVSEFIYSNLTYGMVQVEQKSFNAENTFHLGYAFMFNTFWNLVEGAKVGGEVIWGKRVDKNKISGDALRINFIFYYDF